MRTVRNYNEIRFIHFIDGSFSVKMRRQYENNMSADILLAIKNYSERKDNKIIREFEMIDQLKKNELYNEHALFLMRTYI